MVHELARESAARLDERQGIQSIEVAARVLEALAAGSGPLSLGEVAARADLRPNKVHRYLVSLIRAGLAYQSAVSGRYDLGPALRRIGAESLRRANDVAAAAEFTVALRDSSAHSVVLTVWSDDGPLIVRWDYGSFALPLNLRVGTMMPLLGSAAGRIFLSFLPRDVTDRALRRAQESRRAPMDESEIDAITDDVRASGVATLTGGALIPGASVISAPVFRPSGALSLAVGIVLAGEEVDSVELDTARTMLLGTCRQLSSKLT